MSLALYRDEAVPPAEAAITLVLTPKYWKAHLWRAFDDTTTVMLRLDAPLTVREVTDASLRDALTPFSAGFAKLDVYLERGASVPLPLPGRSATP